MARFAVSKRNGTATHAAQGAVRPVHGGALAPAQAHGKCVWSAERRACSKQTEATVDVDATLIESHKRNALEAAVATNPLWRCVIGIRRKLLAI